MAWIDFAKKQKTKVRRLQEAIRVLAAGRKIGLKQGVSCGILELTMKPATWMATFLLAAVSLAHLLRLVFGVRVTVADSVIPMWVSGIAFLVAAGAALALWRSAQKKG